MDNILQTLEVNLAIHETAYQETEPKYAQIISERRYLEAACKDLRRLISERKNLQNDSSFKEENQPQEFNSENTQHDKDFNQSLLLTSQVETIEPVGEITPLMFKDMKLIEGVVKFLQIVKMPQTTRQIANAMLAGGYKTTAKDFPDTVKGTLKQYIHPKGGVIWHDKKWSLKEWQKGNNNE